LFSLRLNVKLGLLLGLAIAAAPLMSPARARSPRTLPLADHVDLGRMYGGWYIVATIPNAFERGMVEPYDVYSPGRPGTIREDFYVRRGGFGAPRRHFQVRDFVRPGTNNARWGVQIFWPLKLPFLVLYTDPQYRYVLFGEEDRNLGWIYSRSPLIGDDDYRDLLERFAALGYDPSRFRKIVQTPEQVGRPGYWSAGVRHGGPGPTPGSPPASPATPPGPRRSGG
jgi:apolipoprotein D and lipocalin family protein